MKKFKRAVHFDFHTVEGVENLLSEFDAADFAETLKKADVGYINFTAMCNNGFCYYPTNVGCVYPGLERDILGEVIKECHKRDIGVTAYLNVGINFTAAKNHLEWCRISENGNVLETYNNFVHDCDRREGNFFTRTMCFNQKGYVDFVLAIVKEISEYDVDGIFCDGFYPEPCYCPACMEKMLASGVDVSDKEQVYNFQDLSTRRFSEEIRAVLGKNRYAFFNGIAPEFMTNAHAEIESLPSWSWRHYEFFPQHALYLSNLYDTKIYMTGRFQRDWGDFGGIRPRAALENDLYEALLYGYEISFGDHMHPVYGINKEMFRVLGDIFAESKQYEPYTENSKIYSDIAVLAKDYAALDETRYRAALRMLSELHYSCTFINPDMDFSPYKLLIIPDYFDMTDGLIKKIDDYIANGGKLLSSGTAALNRDKTAFAIKDYDYIKFCGLDKSKRAYFKLNRGFKDYSDSVWSIYYYSKDNGEIGGTAVKMKNNGGKEIASYVSAYFDIMKHGIHGCYYTPPKEVTEFSSAILGENSAHVSFDVFTDYGIYFLSAQKELVRQLIEELLPDPVVKTPDLPTTARITIAKKKEYDLLHIKVTYPEHRNFRAIIEEHNVSEQGKTVFVKGKYVAAQVVPDGEILKLTYENGYTGITLPRIVGYAMIMLKK